MILNLSWNKIASCWAVYSPVLHRLGPLSPDSRKCEIDKLFKGGIRCKYALVLGYLAELAVIAFYGICSIYYPSDML